MGDDEDVLTVRRLRWFLDRMNFVSSSSPFYIGPVNKLKFEQTLTGVKRGDVLLAVGRWIC